MGGSGGVLNSLDFCPASLKVPWLHLLPVRTFFTMASESVCEFYTAIYNFTILKTFLEARSQNVSGNKQQPVANLKLAMPKTLFSPTRHPLSPVIFATATAVAFVLFAILGSTSIVIHSVKQHLLRNRRGSDAVTFRDFLRERLQWAFTRANQLH